MGSEQERNHHIWVRLSWFVGAKAISESKDELISEDFNVFGRTGTETWNLLLTPPGVTRSPYVGLFLLYRGEQPTKTSFQLVIVNKCHEASVMKYYKDVTFECHKARRGSYDFVQACKLLDPKQGFIVGGRISIVLQLPTVREGFEWMLQQEGDQGKWIEPIVTEVVSSDDDESSTDNSENNVCSRESSEGDVIEVVEEVVEIPDDDIESIEEVIEITDEEVVEISDDECDVAMIAAARRSPHRIGTSTVRGLPSGKTAMSICTMGSRPRGSLQPPTKISLVSRPTNPQLRQPLAAMEPMCTPKSIPPTIPFVPAKVKPPSAVTLIPGAPRKQMTSARQLQYPATTRPECMGAPRSVIPSQDVQHMTTKFRTQPYPSLQQPTYRSVAQNQNIAAKLHLQQCLVPTKSVMPKRSPPLRCVEPQPVTSSRRQISDTTPYGLPSLSKPTILVLKQQQRLGELQIPAVKKPPKHAGAENPRQLQPQISSLPSRPLYYDTTPLIPIIACLQPTVTHARPQIPIAPRLLVKPSSSAGTSNQLSPLAHPKTKTPAGCLKKYARC